MSTMMNIGDRVLGQFEVLDIIAIEGQAVVAKGLDRTAGGSVAIKQLATPGNANNYAQELARFQRAGSLRIGHPVIVDPIVCRQEGDSWYLVMPFVEGENLDAFVMCRGGRLPCDQAVAIALNIAEGLQALHNKSVIHRDIKPANVMVQRDGQVRILDLGICKLMQSPTITQGTGMLGSPDWMPEEQKRDARSVDHRADLYPLGALLYYMLTGERPARGSGRGSLSFSNPTIPLHIQHICMRMLSDEPQARPQTANEVIIALQGASPAALTACQNCGGQLASGASFCTRCGQRANTAAGASTRCLGCGREVDHQPACPHCRLDFGSAGHGLLFQSGPLAGTTFRIPEGAYTVGREQLNPRDSYISRRQFYVICCNGSVFVQDAGSANQTCINGQPAQQPALLLAGQEIRIAGYAGIYIRH